MKALQLKNGYLLAALSTLWLTACNGVATTPSDIGSTKINAAITVESHPNASFYVRQTEGPKYQAIQIQNNSAFPINLASITLPAGISLESNPSYYISNSTCNLSGQSIATSATCVLLLKSTLSTLGAQISTFGINLTASDAAPLSKTIATTTAYTMYVGGEFSSIGGAASSGNGSCGHTTNDACLLAQYNGSTWSDAVANGDPDDWINTIAVDTAGNLYTGGAFTTIGGESAIAGHVLLAAESTGGWTNAATGADPDRAINTIVFNADNDLYIGGVFSSIGGISASGSGNCGQSLTSACLLAVESAGGWANALHSGGNPDSTINTLTFNAAGNLYAAGRFTTIGGASASGGGNCGPGFNSACLLAVESTGGWANAVTGGNANSWINSISFNSTNNLYVGGNFTTIGGVSVGSGNFLLAAESSNGWGNAVTSGNPDGMINSIAFDTTGNLYTGGLFKSIGGITPTGLDYLLAIESNGSWANAITNANPNGFINTIAFGNSLSAIVIP